MNEREGIEEMFKSIGEPRPNNAFQSQTDSSDRNKSDTVHIQLFAIIQDPVKKLVKVQIYFQNQIKNFIHSYYCNCK